MQLSARALNRATLARQLLLRRQRIAVPDAVRQVLALQAQEPASPYLALWNRVHGFDAADLDRAFGNREVIKGSLARITLHAVHAEDYPPFHWAMVAVLRASRLNDRRFTATGLSVAEVDALLPDVLAFTTKPRTGPEIDAMLTERRGVAQPQIWWAFRTYAPLIHAPTGGPWSFGLRPSFIASDVAEVEREEAVRHLIRRYLNGFGPATQRDFTQFTLLNRQLSGAAWDSLRDELVEFEGPNGERLLDVPGAPLPDADTLAPPRLLGMWDSVLLAYAERDRIIPPAYRATIIRRNGDVLPTVLVDGYAAGVWRAVENGIEVTAFANLAGETWNALEREARSLLRLIADRDPNVYGRYRRWWNDLPGAEMRILPAG